MELHRLVLGETGKHGISFAEGEFLKDGERFCAFAFISGDLLLFVRSDLSMLELMNSIKKKRTCDLSVVSWNAEDNCSTKQHVDLDIESILAYCLESDLERYECWRGDGGESMAEAFGSDDALALLVVYDLLFHGFESVSMAAENGDEDAENFLQILEEFDFNVE